MIPWFIYCRIYHISSDQFLVLSVFTNFILYMEDIEALLFGFQSIADTVDVGYSDVIPGLIGLIPLISVTSVQLAETVMLTLGTVQQTREPGCVKISALGMCRKMSYRIISLQFRMYFVHTLQYTQSFHLCLLGSLAEWLADHPVMVPSVLCIVLPALSDADLSVPAVSALKRICRECKHHLYPHANDILASSQVHEKKILHCLSSLRVEPPLRHWELYIRWEPPLLFF